MLALRKRRHQSRQKSKAIINFQIKTTTCSVGFVTCSVGFVIRPPGISGFIIRERYVNRIGNAHIQ